MDWKDYLDKETREQAQARAQGYSDLLAEMAVFVMKLTNRLWDAEETVRELAQGREE